MQVAIIEPVGGHGGMNYYDFSLAQNLSSSGVEVSVYTCEETTIPQDITYEVILSFQQIWGRKNKFLRAINFFRSLVRTFINTKKKSIRIVHYHFFHYTFLELLCVVTAKISGMKIVVTSHDIESFTNGGVIKNINSLIFFFTDHIIVHNNNSKKELLRRDTIQPDKISIIPHGNYLEYIKDMRMSSATKTKEDLNIQNRTPVILFFGQVKQVKGLDILIKATAKVKEKYPEILLIIAGKVWKDNFRNYSQLIDQLELKENVIADIKYIDDADVYKYYSAADIVALPYRKIYQSGVLLMAMSYGIPAIVSNLEGMTEIITHLKNGFVFKNENVDDLAAKLIDAFSDRERLQQIGECGLKTVTEEYDWKQIGKKTAQVYHAVIEER